MDLCPVEAQVAELYTPRPSPADDEGEFLSLVGQAFMQVGKLGADTLRQLETTLRSTSFLLGATKAPAVDGTDSPPSP
jgi:hypothetical protein